MSLLTYKQNSNSLISEMTEINSDVLEFEILGYRVKFKPDNIDSPVSPSEIVEYLQKEATEMRNRAKNISSGEVAVLLSLKLAEEKLSLEKEYKENITKLHHEVSDAKKVIDSLSI